MIIRRFQDSNKCCDHRICVVPDSIKLRLIKDGANFSPSQKQQFVTLTHLQEGNFNAVINAIFTLDQAEQDQATKTTRVYAMEAEQFPGPIDQIDHDEEDSDAADVLVNVDDLGPWVSGEAFSMTAKTMTRVLRISKRPRFPTMTHGCSYSSRRA